MEITHKELLKIIAEDGNGDDFILTPGEVARLFRVDPKTVARWAKTGRLPFIRTIGGHRRYKMSDIIKLIDTMSAREPASHSGFTSQA